MNEKSMKTKRVWSYIILGILILIPFMVLLGMADAPSTGGGEEITDPYAGLAAIVGILGELLLGFLSFSFFVLLGGILSIVNIRIALDGWVKIISIVFLILYGLVYIAPLCAMLYMFFSIWVF